MVETTATAQNVVIDGNPMTATASRLADGTLLQAHHQWATRPADERFLSLEALYNHVHAARERMQEGIAETKALLPAADTSGEVLLNGAPLTYHAFGQLSKLAGAPPTYLRSLSNRSPIAGAQLAALNLRHGLRLRDVPRAGEGSEGDEPIGDSLKLLVDTSDSRVQALTSPKYGRIWDDDIVAALLQLNERTDGLWKVPTAAYQGELTKQSTTLYGSSQNIFVFLVDGEHTISDPSMGNASVNRGFIVWNSQVGDRTLGILSFRFNFVCQNRMIWGAQDVLQLILRHHAAAPQRFTDDAPNILSGLAKEEPTKIIEGVARARQLLLGDGTRDTVENYLRGRSFQSGITTKALDLSEKQDVNDGMDPSISPFSLWNVVQGLTAAARDIHYADARVEVEQRAGKLLESKVGN